MEQQLFSWKGWDELDTGILQFIRCHLKVPIGNWQIGQYFPYIVLDTQAGQLTLGKDNEDGSTEEHYKLSFVIGDPITN